MTTAKNYKKNGLYKNFYKRMLDIWLSLTALVVFSPVILIISILVRVKLGSPIIFKQKRPGLNEKIFTLYKFRTMTDGKDENGELLPDEMRITDFGRILRSLSLDELPELWNVFKGDMSFVGPRPQLIKDLVFMSREQRRRQTVAPGLTGWAQINGRNGVTWEEKLELDLKYVDNITFVGDWKIIFQTVIKVFKRDGICAEGMDTAEDFGDYLLRINKINKDKYRAVIEESRTLFH